MADLQTEITTTLILKFFKNAPVQKAPGATGFFYEKDNDLYIVTNKHVIYEQDEGGDFMGEQLTDKFLLYLDRDLSVGRKMQYPIELQEGRIFWRRDNPRIDLIMIPLEKGFRENNGIIPIKDSSLRMGDTSIRDEIFTLGYAASSELNDGKILPLFTTGSATNKCKGDVDGKFRLIGDIATFPGMSGSPVFDKTGAVLIGIHSGRHNHQRDMGKIKVLDDQGANIWFADSIPQIISSQNK